MKKLFVGFIIMLAGALSPARAQAGPLSVGSANSASPLMQAIASSKALFKTGDIAGAETALFAVNKHAPGTAEWHRDSGRALIGMASGFHEAGDSATAEKVAKLALAELESALTSPQGDARVRASAGALKGFLLQRFGGDRQAAEAAYAAAIALSPGSTATAAAALQRMRAEDQFLAYRGIGPGAQK